MAFDLTWIGQGGFILTLGDKKLCVDPYLSNSVMKLDNFDRLLPIPVEPKDLKVDMIVTTHDHMDHLDEETLKDTDWDNIKYAGPDSCIRHFKAMGIPEGNLVPLNIGQSVKLGDAVLHGVYAKHTRDSIGVVVEYRGVVMYLVGDSNYDERLAEAKKFNPDILITCINGKLGNMNFDEAATLAKQLKVKAAVPCHYGMFAENTEDPLNFKKALEGSGIAYVELEFNKTYPVDEILPR